MEPNPPPTSGAIARTLASLTPQTIARNVRRKCGTWVELCTTSSSEAVFQSATTPRVSIGTWISRWFRIVCLTTTSAFANASSTPSVLWARTSPTFESSSSWILGAPSASAASGVMTAGSGLYETSTAAAASAAV